MGRIPPQSQYYKEQRYSNPNHVNYDYKSPDQNYPLASSVTSINIQQLDPSPPQTPNHQILNKFEVLGSATVPVNQQHDQNSGSKRARQRCNQRKSHVQAQPSSSHGVRTGFEVLSQISCLLIHRACFYDGRVEPSFSL